MDYLEEGGCCLVAKLCSTLCGPTDCSPPGSFVCGILKARILECIAVCFSRGSSQPRDWTQVSCIGRWIFYRWATREAPWKRMDPLTTEQKWARGAGEWQILWHTYHLLCEPGIWDRCQSPSMNSPFCSRGKLNATIFFAAESQRCFSDWRQSDLTYTCCLERYSSGFLTPLLGSSNCMSGCVPGAGPGPGP